MRASVVPVAAVLVLLLGCAAPEAAVDETPESTSSALITCPVPATGLVWPDIAPGWDLYGERILVRRMAEPGEPNTAYRHLRHAQLTGAEGRWLVHRVPCHASFPGTPTDCVAIAVQTKYVTDESVAAGVARVIAEADDAPACVRVQLGSINLIEWL